jgi:hypothetical protein
MSLHETPQRRDALPAMRIDAATIASAMMRNPDGSLTKQLVCALQAATSGSTGHELDWIEL